MDLNQLLYHHQMALMAVSQARRDGHLLPNFDLPRYYAKRINEYRERRGLADGFAAVIAPEHVSPKADPPVSEPATEYPVFVGDTLIAELLVNEALAMARRKGRPSAWRTSSVGLPRSRKISGLSDGDCQDFRVRAGG